MRHRPTAAVALTLSLWLAAPRAVDAADPVEAERPGPKTVAQLRSVLDVAFARFGEDDIRGFADALRDVDRGIIAGFVPQFEAQLTLQTAKSGPCRRVEFIRREAAGESLTRFYYLAVYDTCVTRWRLDFARPNDRWLLFTFNASSNWSEISTDFAVDPLAAPPVGDRSYLEASEAMEMVAARISAGWYEHAVERLELASGRTPAELQAKEALRWRYETKKSFESLDSHRRLQGAARRRFDRVSVDLLGPSALRFVYLDMSEGEAITWEFYFFKPHDRWNFVSVGVAGDDRRDRILLPMSDRLDEASAGRHEGAATLTATTKDRK